MRIFGLGGDLSEGFNDSFTNMLLSYRDVLEGLSKHTHSITVYCHGSTRGGSMGFVCVADYVVAHSNATFGFPEIRRGGLPGLVSVVAQKRLSREECVHQMLLGDSYDAIYAKTVGLVDDICDSPKVEFKPSKIVLTQPTILRSGISEMNWLNADQKIVTLHVGEVGSMLYTQLNDLKTSTSLRVVILDLQDTITHSDTLVCDVIKQLPVPTLACINNIESQFVLKIAMACDMRYGVVRKPHSELHKTFSTQDEMYKESYVWAHGICLYRAEGMKQTLFQMRGIIPECIETPSATCDVVEDTHRHECNFSIGSFENIVHVIQPNDDLTQLYIHSDKYVFVSVYDPKITLPPEHVLNRYFKVLIVIANGAVNTQSYMFSKAHIVHASQDCSFSDIDYETALTKGLCLPLLSLENTLQRLNQIGSYLCKRFVQWCPGKSYEHAMISMGGLEKKEKIEGKVDVSVINNVVHIVLNDTEHGNTLTPEIIQGFEHAVHICFQV